MYDDKDKKSHSNNEKATHAYKLISEGMKLVEVAIQLGLSERQATAQLSSRGKENYM